MPSLKVATMSRFDPRNEQSRVLVIRFDMSFDTLLRHPLCLKAQGGAVAKMENPNQGF